MFSESGFKERSVMAAVLILFTLLFVGSVWDYEQSEYPPAVEASVELTSTTFPVTTTAETCVLTVTTSTESTTQPATSSTTKVKTTSKNTTTTTKKATTVPTTVTTTSTVPTSGQYTEVLIITVPTTSTTVSTTSTTTQKTESTYKGVLTPSNLTADQLRKGLLYDLKDCADAFIQAEKETGINAIFLSSVAAYESGWGRSNVAKSYNNLFGWTSSSGYAKFDSYYDCILTVAERMKNLYLTPTGKYFRGYEVSDINKCYNGEQYWEDNIIKIMGQIKRRIERS